MLADLSQEVFLWHEERTCKEIGGLFHFLFRYTVAVDKPMSQFVSKREPTPLQRKLIVNDYYGQIGSIRTLHQAGEAGNPIRKSHGKNLETLFLQKFRHVRNRIEAQIPCRAHFGGQLVCITDIAQPSSLRYGAMPIRAV